MPQTQSNEYRRRPLPCLYRTCPIYLSSIGESSRWGALQPRGLTALSLPRFASQKAKGKKPEIPPWEAALMSSASNKKDQKRLEAQRRQAEAEEARKVRPLPVPPACVMMPPLCCGASRSRPTSPRGAQKLGEGEKSGSSPVTVSFANASLEQAKAARAEAEAKALRDAGIQMADDAAPPAGNPNRAEGDDGDWASGIDAALGSLSLESGAGGVEKHPEKRLKAVSGRVLPRPWLWRVATELRARAPSRRRAWRADGDRGPRINSVRRPRSPFGGGGKHALRTG